MLLSESINGLTTDVCQKWHLVWWNLLMELSKFSLNIWGRFMGWIPINTSGLFFSKYALATKVVSSAWPAGCLGVFLHTQTLKNQPSGHPIFLRGISWIINLKLIIEFFHLHTVPMTLYKDIMPYFDKFIHVYGWNQSILWSPLEIWTPTNFIIANFGQLVFKSWLRPWVNPFTAGD